MQEDFHLTFSKMGNIIRDEFKKKCVAYQRKSNLFD